MTKAVFTTKIGSIYDDLPEERYHFPKSYLNAVKETVGDFIIYFEPSRLGANRSMPGRKSYFAVAQVERVEADPLRENHFYARIARKSYIEFPEAVLAYDGLILESNLRMDNGLLNRGSIQRAVRLIPDNEFELILHEGFRSCPVDTAEQDTSVAELAEEPVVYTRPSFVHEVNAKYRSPAFREVIRKAYDSTCAITGLKLINGGGHCEIHAAHIRPVDADGPDSPRNGIALSQTIHWLFDRGVVSLEDDGKILTVKGKIPDPLKRIINPDGYATLPEEGQFRPHKVYLEYHRENIFKG